MISPAVALEHLEECHAAAWCYRGLATELMGRLCVKLELPETLDHWGPHSQTGVLDEQWAYFFHGLHCGFGSKITGQYVEASLGFQGEFGVLDPGFFGRFLQREPDFAALGRLVENDFYDGKILLDVLEREARLTRIEGTHGSGWVAREPQKKTA